MVLAILFSFFIVNSVYSGICDKHQRNFLVAYDKHKKADNISQHEKTGF